MFAAIGYIAQCCMAQLHAIATHIITHQLYIYIYIYMQRTHTHVWICIYNYIIIYIILYIHDTILHDPVCGGVNHTTSGGGADRDLGCAGSCTYKYVHIRTDTYISTSCETILGVLIDLRFAGLFLVSSPTGRVVKERSEEKKQTTRCTGHPQSTYRLEFFEKQVLQQIVKLLLEVLRGFKRFQTANFLICI